MVEMIELLNLTTLFLDKIYKLCYDKVVNLKENKKYEKPINCTICYLCYCTSTCIKRITCVSNHLCTSMGFRVVWDFYVLRIPVISNTICSHLTYLSFSRSSDK